MFVSKNLLTLSYIPAYWLSLISVLSIVGFGFSGAVHAFEAVVVSWETDAELSARTLKKFGFSYSILL